MRQTLFRIHLVALSAVLVACGGGNGGDAGGARPVVIPSVPAGSSEADCQRLCTLAAGEAICTAKHAEFCVAHCRAVTRDLPPACTSCLLAAGTKINGVTNAGSTDTYCSIGGPADLTACQTACDDNGPAAPSPALETLCQLQCAFYVQEPTAIACSAMGSAACLSGCRATIAAKGRVCAQCLIEQTIPEKTCLNNDCDCSPQFVDAASGCQAFCF